MCCDLSGELRGMIMAEVLDASDQLAKVEVIRALLHELSPNKAMPIDLVKWVPIEQVEANLYNPNSVAKVEMNLLYVSIKHDGITQPIVTVRDELRRVWIIIDGFHRYFTVKTNQDIYDACHGLLPIVELDKSINDRMAATVRHNRARGKHSVQGMSGMVFEMLQNGWADAAICNELGMTAEELLRLKHITGFSKLFENSEYSKAWKAKSQLRIEREYKQAHPEEVLI